MRMTRAAASTNPLSTTTAFPTVTINGPMLWSRPQASRRDSSACVRLMPYCLPKRPARRSTSSMCVPGGGAPDLLRLPG